MPYAGIETTVSAAANATAFIVRQLDEELRMFTPADYPFLNEVGMNSLGFEVISNKIEWQTKDLFPTTDAINMAGNFLIGDTALVVDNGTYFHLGDILFIEAELVWVNGISGNTLFVTRAFGGTTAVQHANNTVILILANARLEGSSPGVARQVSLSQFYNYTQIIDETVSATGTQLSVTNMGLPQGDALLQDRLQDRLKELNQKWDRALAYNRRQQPSASIPGAWGGLVQFVTDVDALAGAVLQIGHFETALDNVFGRVTSEYIPDTVWSGTWLWRKIMQWYQAADPVERLGGIPAKRIMTAFGALDYVYDRNLRNNEAWILKANGNLQMGPMSGRALAEHEASVPGEDATRRVIRGEYTTRLLVPDGCVLIQNFSVVA